ncbi:hypothetical protein [Listeria fleischmannii]|uniref:Uncharacterized protein n=1 Tax=Listeria fleischmannii TaxID=1069827 RepID=A0A841YCF6_9LIST|nr:hypothetical protein [Listeria fleischmannii]EIA21143.1 hypothetical protein KKC_02819 [Listeria fleischmannii subsp. coloradonensis]MBC1397878.1 hypothetical protein [Listeria fleischmannii]MBC1417465.1 hypothetical protein [Listeria fleischmannii]MBC1427357.1 hypothetical protein [Listeria fleischmannii]STY33969.1 Uncharacterised protein [Listeria fleischmannii subsp. coloradonensis]
MYRDKMSIILDKEEELQKALQHIRDEQAKMMLLLNNPSGNEIHQESCSNEYSETVELQKLIDQLRSESLDNLEEQIKRCMITCQEQLLVEEEEIGRKLYQVQCEKKQLSSAT